MYASIFSLLRWCSATVTICSSCGGWMLPCSSQYAGVVTVSMTSMYLSLNSASSKSQVSLVVSQSMRHSPQSTHSWLSQVRHSMC